MNIQDILDLKGSEVITVLPTATIRDITVILADRGIGTVMVTDSSGNLVGIVSERDIVRCIAEQGEISFALHAGDLMSTDLITCTPETKVTDALAPMSRHGIRSSARDRRRRRAWADQYPRRTQPPGHNLSNRISWRLPRPPQKFGWQRKKGRFSTAQRPNSSPILVTN
jgi:hypothetical protein